MGPKRSTLGQSLYLREVLGLEEGPSPSVDLLTEKMRGEFVRAAIRSGEITACHDVSDGGLAVTLAEMCMASSKGMKVDVQGAYVHAALFGEDQSRYVLTMPQSYANMFAANAEGSGVYFSRLGTVDGDRLTIGKSVSLSVSEMTAVHEAWLPSYMEGETDGSRPQNKPEKPYAYGCW